MPVISALNPIGEEFACRRIVAHVIGSTSITSIHFFISLFWSRANADIFSYTCGCGGNLVISSISAMTRTLTWAGANTF